MPLCRIDRDTFMMHCSCGEDVAIAMDLVSLRVPFIDWPKGEHDDHDIPSDIAEQCEAALKVRIT